MSVSNVQFLSQNSQFSPSFMSSTFLVFFSNTLLDSLNVVNLCILMFIYESKSCRNIYLSIIYMLKRVLTHLYLHIYIYSNQFLCGIQEWHCPYVPLSCPTVLFLHGFRKTWHKCLLGVHCFNILFTANPGYMNTYFIGYVKSVMETDAKNVLQLWVHMSHSVTVLVHIYMQCLQ